MFYNINTSGQCYKKITVLNYASDKKCCDVNCMHANMQVYVVAYLSRLSRLSNKYRKTKIACLRFVMCLLLAPGFQASFFFPFLMQPLTVLMNQARQAVCAIKQSIYLDVYGLSLQNV